MHILRLFHGNRVLSLMLSNFLFVGSYALLGSNALFLLQDLTEQDKRWIILGMSLFATFQIGGAWFLSWIRKGADSSLSVCMTLRGLAILLLAFRTPWSICLGLLAFGLSHAVFYKISRYELANYIRTTANADHNAYLYFGLTTNLAFIILSGLGAQLIGRSLDLHIGIPLDLGLAAISFVLLRASSPSSEDNSTTEASPTDAVHSKVDFRLLIYDTLRFGAFLLPYAVLNSMIALKVQSAGLPSTYNAFLIGLNSAVIIALQVAGMKFKNLFSFSLLRYDLFSLAAVVFMITGFWVNVWLLVPVILVYSLCEAYQMPNVEYLLFTVRKYESTIINRFFLLDSLICFVGPWLGILASGNPVGTRYDDLIQRLVDRLIHFYG